MTVALLALETSIALQSVRQKIAELIHDNLDIPVDKVLEDIPFPELHKDFDSLTLLEVQLLLEKAYGFEFEINLHDKYSKLPNNATELAQEQELIRKHARHGKALKNKSPLIDCQATNSLTRVSYGVVANGMGMHSGRAFLTMCERVGCGV